jgi:hypothetical protein
MRKIILKNLFFLICITILINPAFTQIESDTTETFEETPYSEWFLSLMEDTCDHPIVTLSPVIHYTSGPRAYIEFSDWVSNIRIREQGAASFLTLEINDNKKLLSSLFSDKMYEVYTLSRCGEYELAGMINTHTGGGDIIEVSSSLYRVITDFQVEETISTPFDEYLNSRSDVSFFEKVYFIQQFFLGGALISEFSETNLPGVPTLSGCQCRFVFNYTQFAAPGRLDNGIINPRIEHKPKESFNGDSYNAHWWGRSTKGAAKWHQLWTEGFKAGDQDNKYTMRMADSLTTFGTQYAQLRYNYFCVNFAQLPQGCECDRELWLYWRYDTRLGTFAKTLRGSSNALAATEDIGLVILKRDGIQNIPYLIDGNVARSVAECHRKVNPEFWAKAVEVAFNVGFTVYGFVVGSDIPQNMLPFFNQGVTGLTSSIQDLIRTPYLSEKNCDAGDDFERTLCFGDTMVLLQANRPISLFLFSNTSLMAGGKNSWHSWSRVLSDFYVAGYVPGGYSHPASTHCCTPKIGNWVLATVPGAPFTMNELLRQVGNIFTAWAPWPYPQDPGTNILQLPAYEYHSMRFNVANCSLENLVDSDGAHQRTHSKEEDVINAEEYEIRLFDFSGRIVFSNKMTRDIIDIRSYIRALTPGLPTGIYFIHISSSDRSIVRKIFMD